MWLKIYSWVHVFSLQVIWLITFCVYSWYPSSMSLWTPCNRSRLNFKDQFDGDFYDYDTWTEPPEGQGTTTTATTTTRRPFTFRTKPPPKSVTKKPSWSQDVSDPKYSSAKDQGHTKQPYPTVNPVPKQPPPAIKDPTTVLPSTLLNPDPKPTKPPLKDPYLPKTLNPDIATQPPPRCQLWMGKCPQPILWRNCDWWRL